MNIFGFQEHKIKPYLKMAVQRIQLANNKKTTALKHQKREIAMLLEQGKVEKARIKVEHVIRDDFAIEAREIMELMCELLHERVRQISSCKTCPPSLVEAVCSLCWAVDNCDIAELTKVRTQLRRKFKDLATASKKGAGVNQRLQNKLTYRPPSAELVTRYLAAIAQAYDVAWVLPAAPTPTIPTIPRAPTATHIPNVPNIPNIPNAYVPSVLNISEFSAFSEVYVLNSARLGSPTGTVQDPDNTACARTVPSVHGPSVLPGSVLSVPYAPDSYTDSYTDSTDPVLEEIPQEIYPGTPMEEEAEALWQRCKDEALWRTMGDETVKGGGGRPRGTVMMTALRVLATT